MMKKKAFTLTELLVVVVIIGTLAAVVLPKFTKVLETRKTTEAEEFMAAIRNEQEARCMLDKKYALIGTKLASWPNQTGSNYTYTLERGGITASRLDADKLYELKMLKYRDGGICCSGSYCGKLNKAYPLCEEYEAVGDPDCEVGPVPPPPPPPTGCDPDGTKEAEHSKGELISESREDIYWLVRTVYDHFDKSEDVCAWISETTRECKPTEEQLEEYDSKVKRDKIPGKPNCVNVTTYGFDMSACDWVPSTEKECIPDGNCKWVKGDLITCSMSWDLYCQLGGSTHLGDYTKFLQESPSCSGDEYRGGGSGVVCEKAPTAPGQVCMSYERHIYPPACSVTSPNPEGETSWGTARKYISQCEGSVPSKD